MRYIITVRLGIKCSLGIYIFLVQVPHSAFLVLFRFMSARQYCDYTRNICFSENIVSPLNI